MYERKNLLALLKFGSAAGGKSKFKSRLNFKYPSQVRRRSARKRKVAGLSGAVEFQAVRRNSNRCGEIPSASF